MAFNVKLYGTDIEITTPDGANIVDLLAEATDYVEYSIDCEGIYPTIAIEQPSSYGGKLFSSNTVKMEFTIKSLPFAFPNTDTSIIDYYNIPFYKKQFHYLYVNNFPLNPLDSNDPEYCHRIAIDGIAIEHLNEQGAKSVEIKCQLGAAI